MFIMKMGMIAIKSGRWSIVGENDLAIEVEGMKEVGWGSWAAYYLAKKLYPNVKDFTGFFYG